MTTRQASLAAAVLFTAALPTRGQATKADIVDLSHVPQTHETASERDVRMEWWRDAKFGMFLHWGPVSLSGKELSWSRQANRPWDIDRHGPRTSDPTYDNLYKQFNPVKFDAERIARIATNAGMKYIVLVAKHHDGFSLFDSKLTDYDIMATPYRRDLVAQFVDACRHTGMRAGLYYSTRDWYHPDYLVGDNAKYDAWYRGQVEELVSNYGMIDILWFDHVGGRDWGKWRFDKLFAMLYRHQPNLVVNNRAARFCGPASPEDRGPASPLIAKMCEGDFGTPEQTVGHMDLAHDWESCMTLVGGQWSYLPGGKMYSLEETLGILIDCITGGGNLLLNVGPMPSGEIEPRQVELLEQVGAWIRPRSKAIYGTRGGPYANGAWGGSTHSMQYVYLFIRKWPGETLKFGPLPRKVVAARSMLGSLAPAYRQDEKGLEITLPASERKPIATVIQLTLDEALPPVPLMAGPR